MSRAKKKPQRPRMPSGLAAEIKQQLLAKNAIVGIAAVCVDRSGKISFFSQACNAKVGKILEASCYPITRTVELAMHMEAKGLLL